MPAASAHAAVSWRPRSPARTAISTISSARESNWPWKPLTSTATGWRAYIQGAHRAAPPRSNPHRASSATMATSAARTGSFTSTAKDRS